MKKTIMFRMTNDMAAKIGHPANPGFGLALRPMEIETENMTPAAAWIAEHITATYVVDEWRDKIGITAVAGSSMKDRDEARGVNADEIAKLSSAWGDAYTAPIKLPEITFPIYGKSHKRPEDVIEQTAKELQMHGCASLIASNGDSYTF